MTVRNIRAHQSRGLLPPPNRNGRLAYYGYRHVERLRHILDLQERGFNLAAIGALLRASDGEAGAGETLLRMAIGPLLRDDSMRVTRAEIERMFPHDPNPGRWQAVMDRGLLARLSDDVYEFPSRQLVEVAVALTGEGVSPHDMVGLMLSLIGGVNDVAGQFVDICLRTAWQPYAQEGLPDKRWDEVQERFRRLQELGTSVLTATFALAVRRAAETRIAQESDDRG